MSNLFPNKLEIGDSDSNWTDIVCLGVGLVGQVIRPEHAASIITACNAHDQLVAENAALHEQLARKDEACNNAINAALTAPDPVREQLVAALQSMEMALAGYLHQNDITRSALSKSRAARAAAGVA